MADATFRSRRGTRSFARGRGHHQAPQATTGRPTVGSKEDLDTGMRGLGSDDGLRNGPEVSGTTPASTVPFFDATKASSSSGASKTTNQEAPKMNGVVNTTAPACSSSAVLPKKRKFNFSDFESPSQPEPKVNNTPTVQQQPVKQEPAAQLGFSEERGSSSSSEPTTGLPTRGVKVETPRATDEYSPSFSRHQGQGHHGYEEFAAGDGSSRSNPVASSFAPGPSYTVYANAPSVRASSSSVQTATSPPKVVSPPSDGKTGAGSSAYCASSSSPCSVREVGRVEHEQVSPKRAHLHLPHQKLGHPPSQVILSERGLKGNLRLWTRRWNNFFFFFRVKR